MILTKEHWIANYGKMPSGLHNDTMVYVVLRDGYIYSNPNQAGEWRWWFSDRSPSCDIVAWRKAEK